MIKELKFLQKDSVQKAWEKVAESLDFAENSNFIRESTNWEYFIRESTNWEYFEDNCSKKIDALFCVQNSYRILANHFDFCRCYLGFQ